MSTHVVVQFLNVLRTQKVLVEVTILDANDNGPVIVTNDSFVEINVEEDQIAGQLIFVVEVSINVILFY